jgi:fumarate reductase flavoprotein subunit
MKYYSNLFSQKRLLLGNTPAPIPDSEIAETMTADVVVIGGGISGLAAAARITYKGLSCIVIDKM